MKKNTSQESKGKVRIVMFELEGSDDTLRESIRSISHLLTRASAKPGLPASGVPVTGGLPESFELVNEEEQDEQDLEEEDNGQVARSKKRTFKSPTILDLDLNSELSLENFLKQAKPNNQNKKYLAIAYWFKEHRKIPEISVDHVHTALRSMSWNSAKEPSKPFRNMKAVNGWFNNGSKQNMWAINHIGEGVVMKMLKGENVD